VSLASCAMVTEEDKEDMRAPFVGNGRNHFGLLLLAVAAVGLCVGLPGSLVGNGNAVKSGPVAFRPVPDDYYGYGRRDYVAHLNQPIGSTTVTLVLVHAQASYNGGQSGVLWRKVMTVGNPHARVMRGHLSFSKVYFVSGPAGAPPFGAYRLTIYRGSSPYGVPLARGQFEVIED